MGFCTDKQYKRFLDLCPVVERFMIEGGTMLIKLWLEVSNGEQQRRFEARIKDPLRQWKLSPMDLPSRTRWYDYSRARDRMLEATDTTIAPWYILRSDDKRTARLNAIAHILSQIAYKKVHQDKVKLPGRSKKHAYDDQASLHGRRFVEERITPKKPRKRPEWRVRATCPGYGVVGVVGGVGGGAVGGSGCQPPPSARYSCASARISSPRVRARSSSRSKSCWSATRISRYDDSPMS